MLCCLVKCMSLAEVCSYKTPKNIRTSIYKQRECPSGLRGQTQDFSKISPSKLASCDFVRIIRCFLIQIFCAWVQIPQVTIFFGLLLLLLPSLPTSLPPSSQSSSSSNTTTNNTRMPRCRRSLPLPNVTSLSSLRLPASKSKLGGSIVARAKEGGWCQVSVKS